MALRLYGFTALLRPPPPQHTHPGPAPCARKVSRTAHSINFRPLVFTCVRWRTSDHRTTPSTPSRALALQKVAIDIPALRGRLHPGRCATARAERGHEDRALARRHRHASVRDMAAEEQRGACGWSQHGRRCLDAMSERVLRPEAGAWRGRWRWNWRPRRRLARAQEGSSWARTLWPRSPRRSPSLSYGAYRAASSQEARPGEARRGSSSGAANGRACDHAAPPPPAKSCGSESATSSVRLW